jgi:hypothetical protein
LLDVGFEATETAFTQSGYSARLVCREREGHADTALSLRIWREVAIRVSPMTAYPTDIDGGLP